MINALMKTYDYYTYGGLNEYGQETLSKDIQGQIKIAINTTNVSTQDNIRYKDASYIGLTFNRNVSEAFVIQYGEEKLKVLTVNPMGRYKQVFLKNI